MKKAVKENPDVKAALKSRGIMDFAPVECSGYGTGYFGKAEEQGRRLFRVICAQQYGPLQNWGPIEGLTILWDENEKKVLRVIDTGAVPMPHPEANYDLASVGTLREVPPMTVQQPLGPSFRLDGQSVSWQKWNFHFRIDRRGGTVVSNVNYQDGTKARCRRCLCPTWIRARPGLPEPFLMSRSLPMDSRARSTPADREGITTRGRISCGSPSYFGPPLPEAGLSNKRSQTREARLLSAPLGGLRDVCGYKSSRKEYSLPCTSRFNYTKPFLFRQNMVPYHIAE